MADYESPTLSRRQYIEAGKFVAQAHPYTPETLEPFRIVNNWRSSHVLPMIRVRQELSAKVAKVQVGGGFTAARIKRMQSIRKKLILREGKMNLIQIQDIAGVRAVLRSKKEMDRIITAYRDGVTRHEFRYESPYIDNPKAGGYRSHHIVLRFKPAAHEDERYGKLSVELQIRTRLQHCWATAVEAVGLFRNEDLKGGQGHPDWLRLFELMSTEFAEIEDLPIVPNTSSRRAERKHEILELEDRLNVTAVLNNINRAIADTEAFQHVDPGYYLITFDNMERKVRVDRYVNVTNTLAGYYTIENRPHVDVVLVEVDKVANLKQAYPNYFLDVGRFVFRLRKVVESNYAARAPGAVAEEHGHP